MKKQFLSTVSAGILGSALTLGVVANTDWLAAPAPETAVQAADSNYEVTHTNATPVPSLSDMVEQSSGAVVSIVNYKEVGNRFAQNSQSMESGSGSGFIYKKDGKHALIATNNHVIEGAQKVEVVFANGDKTDAEVVGKDALSDLAVLKIDAKYADSVLAFGDSNKLRAGDQVVAIGNPLGLDFSGTVTQGIVSAVNRSIEVKTAAGAWEMNVIQTDAAINPGNSGGALLNEQGEVIGINSLKIAENGVEGLGFAIPSDEAIPLLEEIVAHGQVKRAYLGVSLADLAAVPYQYVQQLPESVKGGVMVASVDPQSPAGKAGLKEEDVITAINGTDIADSVELRKFLYTELAVGDKAVLTVYHGDQKRNVDVQLQENPELGEK